MYIGWLAKCIWSILQWNITRFLVAFSTDCIQFVFQFGFGVDVHLSLVVQVDLSKFVLRKQDICLSFLLSFGRQIQ